jgi:23S rRNA (uracil1939-C5)-methyltransferase
MAKQTILSYEVVELSDIAPTGEAIGYLDGLLVYVPFGVPGETVRVELVTQTRTFARARLVEIITPAPERITPLCDYFGRCGGCDWQHMRYAAQVVHKSAAVRQQLTQVAKLNDPDVRPCVSSFYAYDYRNSARFAVLPGGRPAYPGLNPKELIAVDECPILEPALEDELHKAALLGVGARREWDIRVPEPIPVGNFDYYVGPKSFFAVNTLAAGTLVEEVIAAMQPTAEDTMLDLYCGIGLFTLPLAVMTADVIGVEPNADAARDARRNVASIRPRIYNKVPPRILTSELGPALARPEIKTHRWQGVVVSPPSRGLNLTAIHQIAKLSVPRLVYVSSDTATLGRDIKALVGAGYQMEYAQPVDMMPQTRHVQTVVRLTLS